MYKCNFQNLMLNVVTVFCKHFHVNDIFKEMFWRNGKLFFHDEIEVPITELFFLKYDLTPFEHKDIFYYLFFIIFKLHHGNKFTYQFVNWWILNVIKYSLHMMKITI